MTKQIGLFGYPLERSISPEFQQAALDYYSIPARYHAWPTPPEALPDGVNKLRGHGYLGANVTIPHKVAVRPLLDASDESATAVGAVNTIVKEGNRLVGHNTDIDGFLRSLREKAGFDTEGKSVLLLGAGGAARAAAFGLTSEGVDSLTIANRTLERARSLARDLKGTTESVSAISMGRDEMGLASAEADLIVNATSIGMGHGSAEGLSPLDGDLITPDVLVYDMVYTPRETPLMKAAQRAGADTLGGLWMLIFQGAASFQLWTGNPAPIDVMFRAGEQAQKALEAAT